MKCDICRISFGAFVQTSCHKEEIVFSVVLEGIWKMSRRVLHVSPEPGEVEIVS